MDLSITISPVEMSKYLELFCCNAGENKDKHRELMLSPSCHLSCLKAFVTLMGTCKI